jgi:hypothetical protein
MIPKKRYIKPEINRIELDNSISLVMMSAPHDPPPRGAMQKKDNTPFASPFGDKPFG